MDNDERVAWETMKAWREARDTHRPGSPQYEKADREFKKWEAEYYRVKK